MPNDAIRTAARNSDVFLWEIAERLNLSDSSFSRKLRRELPAEEQARVLAAIDAVKAERKAIVAKPKSINL